MNPTPSEPHDVDHPSWGTTPAAPPTGSGTEAGPSHEPSSEPSYGPSHEPFYGPSSEQRPPRSGVPGARFFDAVRGLGIVRPDDDRRVAGVAAGLARRWNVDPLAVRVGFVLFTLIGGLGLTLYGLGWLLLPHPDGRIHAQQALTGTVTAGFVGALATVVLTGPHFYGPLLPLALIGFIVWRLVANRRHQCRA